MIINYGTTTCPFCCVINRFFHNEIHCPHYLDIEEVQIKSTKLLVKYYLAVFRENGVMKKVTVEEKSDEDN